MEIKKGRNSVYEIGYHMVWCTKYRKPILEGELSSALGDLLYKIADDNDFTIENMEIMTDHIRLFVTASPNHLIADVVKTLKGVSARFLFKQYPSIKSDLYGGHLWNPSYYVGTVGHISEDTVRKYIDTQKERS